MSAIKERAKKLIEQLPDEVVAELLEDLEDMLDLERAIAEEGDKPGIPLEDLIKELEAEGKL